MRLFSQLSEFLLCSFVTRKNPKLRVSERVKACLHTKRTKAVSRSKAPAQRFTIQIKLCVPVALFSPLLSLRGKVGNGATRCTRFPFDAALQRSNMHRSFSSFAANNNSRSYSAVFRRLLLLMFFIAKVIRRQRRNTAPLKIEGDTE